MAGGRKPAKKKKKTTVKKPPEAPKRRVARRRVRPTGRRPKVFKAPDAIVKAKNAIAAIGLLQLGLMKKITKNEKTGKKKIVDIGSIYDMKMSSDDLNHLIREVNRKLRMEHKDELCNICSKNNVWRIYLRQCGHFICLSCIYSYLKTKIGEDKARIPCPVAICHRRIHENDVDTLLNPQLTQLDEFLDPEERKNLRDQHHSTSVRYALGPEECTVNCPECEIPYPLEPGCNYVKCANKKCKTWFCSGCGDKVDNFAHFARGGKCNIGSTDVYRIAYLLRMLLTMSLFGLILLLPAFVYAMHFILPIVVGFGIASAIVRLARKCFNNIIIKFVLVILAILPASVIGFICAIFTIPVGFVFSILYLELMTLRFIPASLMNRVALWTIRKILKLMGFAAADLASNEGERAKLLVEIDEWQVAQEISEKIGADDMNQLDARIERILHEDRVQHKALAEGEDA